MQQGALPVDSRRFWIVTPDDRLSPEHATIPSLNPIGRGMEEPFDTPDGLFMYPPSRPNCRCGIGLGIGTGEAAAALPPQHVFGVLPKAPPVISKLALQPIRRLKLRSKTAGTELKLAKGATAAERETAALMVQGARDMQALGFDLKGITMAPASRETMGSLAASYKAKEVRLLSQPFRVHGQSIVKGTQGKPPWAASDTWSGAVHHEFGHALYDKANPGLWDAFRTQAWKGTTGRTTAQQVSRYAMTSPSEFVAETFRGLVAGKEYSDDVLRLYVKFRGPVAPR
ncbi:hypothetical protein LCGC14_1996790 [marine sediment metagenome]|uniref:Phage head morphogenesis domain-containing protein n=1 Tax=marine sediment metagenome TaxID=412755 RepID=A0A0F9I1I2_9ZZZZ